MNIMDLIVAPAWWVWIAAFFAAAFLVNGAPHYIHGIAGKQFPTPFSGGAGTLDSPVRNVLWGSGNLIAGAVLLWTIRDGLANPLVIAELAVCGVALGALLGALLSRRDKSSKS